MGARAFNTALPSRSRQLSSLRLLVRYIPCPVEEEELCPDLVQALTRSPCKMHIIPCPAPWLLCKFHSRP